MTLLPELDDEKTIQNVRLFFEKDFEKLQRMAHIAYVDIGSPVISGMPATHSSDNASESKSTLHVYAKDMLEKVKKACCGMDRLHREFMEYRYFKRLKWYEIEAITGYHRSRGNEILNEACLQFAWAFADTEDFRVFKIGHSPDKGATLSGHDR